MSSLENERIKQDHFDAYQTIISNDFVENIEVITLNAEDFSTAKQKSYLQFYIPQLALSVTARTQNVVDLNNGGYSWEGKFKNGTLSLTSNELGVYGQISYNKRVFNIQYVSDNTAFIFEYDQEYLNSTDCSLGDSDEKFSPGVKDVGHSNRNANGNIDVMVLYTPAAAGTGFDMNQMANTALSQWITASINSNVNTNLSLVNVSQLNFTETNDIVDDFNRLSNNSTAQLRRNFHKADIVVLLTNGNYGAVNGRVQAIGPSESEAYTIMQVGAATSIYTFIHEVGHLIGARHQNDTTPGDAHGYSWSKPGILNTYGSIMQTRRAGLTAITRVLHFSNPYRQHEGENTGTLSYNFNARVINVNGSIVEDFRFAGPNVNMSVSILGPSSAEDYDPLSFTGTVNDGQSPYTYLWEMDSGSGYTQAGTSLNFNTTMPLDDDLNVRFTATGSNGVSASKTRFVRNLNENGGYGDECPDLYDTARVLDQEIAMFPNPVVDMLNIRAPDQHHSIRIFNTLGNQLNTTVLKDTTSPPQGNYSIDVSAYAAGLYILSATSQNGQTHNFKFVKK